MCKITVYGLCPKNSLTIFVITLHSSGLCRLCKSRCLIAKFSTSVLRAFNQLQPRLISLFARLPDLISESKIRRDNHLTRMDVNGVDGKGGGVEETGSYLSSSRSLIAERDTIVPESWLASGSCCFIFLVRFS